MSVSERTAGNLRFGAWVQAGLGHSRRNEWVYVAYKMLSLAVVDRAIFVIFLLHKGFDPLHIGILQSVFFFANIVAEVPAGLFADAFGRKLSVMVGLVSYCVYAVGATFWGSFAEFLALYALLGIALAFVYGSDTALIYDSLAAQGRAGEFNHVQLKANALGMISGAVAILAGGLLQKISWNAVYGGYLVVNLAAICVWSCAAETTADHHGDGQRNAAARHLRDYIRGHWRQTALPVLGITVFAAATTPFFTFSQALLSQHGLSVQNITWFFCGAQLLIGVAYLVLQRSVSFLSFYPVALLSTALTALLLALLFLDIPAVALSAFLLAMVFSPVVTVVSNNHFNMRLPSSARASFLSVIGFCMSAAIAVMYFVYGQLTEFMPLHTVMGWTSLVSLLAFGIFAVAARTERRGQHS